MTSPNVDTSNALDDRLDFIKLDKSALSEMASLEPLVARHIDNALTLFYERIAEVPEVSRFFSSKDHMKQAQGLQNSHWRNIAAGKLDADYFAAVNRIGNRHAKIGLEPRWYIGGYSLVLETLIKGIIHDFMDEKLGKQSKKSIFSFGGKDNNRDVVLNVADELASKLTLLLKAALIDMDISVSTYFDKLRADAAERDAAVKDKIDHAVSVTGDALRKLADFDLTANISEEMDGDFEQIKQDTNAVSHKLADIIGQLQQTSGSLKTATSEILSGANDLSARTTRQAASIEETSATMEQLSATVTENVKKANAATNSVVEVVKTASDGASAMENASDAMERITSSSARISNVIGMIDDIAFQTNLLALNASVEAASAGDAGKGFAVVAQEVRRLAQSAAEASKEVKVLIEQSSSDVSTGSKFVTEATEKLNQMLGVAEKSNELMASIVSESQAQASSIEEISAAVRQMDEITQQNAALVEQTNAAIEQTETQANELDRIVAVFSLGNGGGTVPTRTGPGPNRSTHRRSHANLHLVN